MVFRRIYGVEIDRVSAQAIEDDFKKELATARRRVAQQKGVVAEHRVRYRLLVASLRGATLGDIVISPPPGGAVVDPGEIQTGPPLGPFTTIRKARFHIDQEHSLEIDLHAISESTDGTDLMIEVKDWQREPTGDVIRRFIEVEERLVSHLEKKTAFLFYSEGGLGEEQAAMLFRAGILIIDVEKLASYEMSPVYPSTTL